jgi:hypothetical protein
MEKQNQQLSQTTVMPSVLFDWFDNYLISKIGKKVLRFGDIYDERFNNVLISICVCFSESKELIEKFDIHYHPYSILSNSLKTKKQVTFFEIDKLRLQKGIDKILNLNKDIFTDFEFCHFAESMHHYWDCFKFSILMSKITKKYYFPIEAERIIKSNKGLSNTIF